MFRALVFLVTGLNLLFSSGLLASSKNGFSLESAIIPSSEIFRGGPAKDGIPAIDKPRFVEARHATFLDADDRILGFVSGNEARAYPIRILNWHEIVNDHVNDQAIVITYCPLCGTGMAFSSQVEGRTLQFGVSGLLYQSDVLLYDRQSESLWSQIRSQAVSGTFAGSVLEQLPLQHTTWKHWRAQYPTSRVLSTETGALRDYNRDPYAGYSESRRLFFDVNHAAPSHYHPKERVLGVRIANQTKAYPFSELDRFDKASFKDTIGGTDVLVHWDRASASAIITNIHQQALPSTIAYWFAWFTFHPRTLVFQAKPP